MKNKLILSILWMVLCCAQAALSQTGVVSVSPVTGTASAVIPIYTLTRGQVTVPIALTYGATGIKPKDVENNAGMGWFLQVGGQVTRQLRGLPDDIKYDQSMNARLGWLYINNGTDIDTMTLKNNGSNCSFETTDIARINSDFGNLSDAEPDIFNVSAPGLSCQLIFDKNHNIQPVTYQDLKIALTYDTGSSATSGNILSFSITNDKGITYVFGSPERIYRQTVSSSPSTIGYFKNDYNLYQNQITYNDNWHLTSILDANGNGVSMTYTTGSLRNSADTVVLYQGSGTGGAVTTIRPYSVQTGVRPQLLQTVWTVNNDVTGTAFNFYWSVNSSSGTNQSVVDSISGMGKHFRLNYRALDFARGSNHYYRYFLETFQDLGSYGSTNSPVNYSFTYVGETKDLYHSTTTLSDSTSTQIDYWGYMNRNTTSSLVPQLLVNSANGSYPRYAVYATSAGSDYANYLAGTNRFADSVQYVSAGSLNKITYASGGSTNLVYEPNDYYDVPSGATLRGGGLRIKQVIDSVGNGSTNNLIRNYSYLDSASTTRSSGRPVTMPEFAFAIPYSGSATGNDYFNYSTMRSATDLSQEDHSIMYGYVKESRTGAGSTVYKYYNPAMNWDLTATPVCSGCSSDWSRTYEFRGRTNCTSGYTPTFNRYYSYPFVPNTNYDFERGMLLREANYNETGGEVSETDYTYARTGTPIAIKGLRFDYNGGTSGVFGYAIYSTFANSSELVTKQVTKIYNSGTPTVAQQATTNYSYGSTYHKLAQTSVINSDGTTLYTNYKYAKDYTTSSGATNAYVAALYHMQQIGMNTPVEMTTQVQRDSLYTTSANLTLYNAFSVSGNTFYLPIKTEKFNNARGVTNFSPFSVTSGTTPGWDSRYFNNGNITQYDWAALPITADDGFRHKQTGYTDFYNNRKAVQFSNTSYTSVAFNNFDSSIFGAPFAVGGTFSIVTPGHTGNAISFGTSNSLTKTIALDSLATSYIFSIWVKSTASGTLTVTTTGTGTTTSLAYGNTGGAWKYYRVKVPLTGLGATFTTTVTTSGSISIDDVLLYPDNAEVATYAYDPVTFFKTAETNTNGVSAYYTNDEWGRMTFAYDQDKNILGRNTYVLPSGSVPGYTQTDAVKVSGITTSAQVDTLSLPRKQSSRVYYDGLGRSLQSVAMQANPSQKDIIRPVVYDNLGRSIVNYLPYADTTSATIGSFRSTAITDQNSFYHSTNPTLPVDSAYSRSIVEESPLQRTLEAGSVGNGFQPGQHYSSVSYRANTSGDGNIIIWKPDGTNSGSYYAVSSLTVTDGTDAAGHEALVFTDLAGRTILKRQINSPHNLDTYYIYNNSGAIAFVVPPQATYLVMTNGYALTNATVANLIYSYSYDYMGRLASKTIPGGIISNIVYDPLNRPVLTQDANMHANNQWGYIKYDAKGRPVSSGTYTDATHTTQSSMQTYVNGLTGYATVWWETRNSTISTGYYSNSIFPTSVSATGYSYFDDYDLNHDGTADYGYKTQGIAGEETPTTATVCGMPTMTRKITVGKGVATPVWLLSAVFYDHNLHPIQTRSNNILNFTTDTLTDNATIAPDFTGKPMVTSVQKATGSTNTIKSIYAYDNSNRVTSLQQSYNGGTAITIGSYKYNPIGQLIQKSLGAINTSAPANVRLYSAITTNTTTTATESIVLDTGFSVDGSVATFSASIVPGSLQNVDYRYNIRGLVTSINNSKLANDGGITNSDTNDLFGMTLLYDQTDSDLGNSADYTGKLSGVKWMTLNSGYSPTYERAYTYGYDTLSRLVASNYAERATASTGSFNTNRGGFREIESYDLMGNIQKLSRYASTPGTSSIVHIDSLAYGYLSTNPNRLNTVVDATGNSLGFYNFTGTSTGTYAYDSNGNMTTDPYKGLTTDYNVLNKTDSVIIASTGRIRYTYDASGTVIRKQQYNNSGSLTTTTDYLDGFVYVNSSLSYAGMPEGRVLNVGGTLKPEYVITDQQGNARISFQDNGSGVAVVTQENSYYGFGMVMPNSPVGTPTTPNKNLYNGGSEWQNDFSNLPDLMQTFYRNYDAALGRWTGTDPQAESAADMSVYQYAGNNPVMMNDPMGNLLPIPGSKEAPSMDVPSSSYPSWYYMLQQRMLQDTFSDWLQFNLPPVTPPVTTGGGSGNGTDGTTPMAGVNPPTPDNQSTTPTPSNSASASNGVVQGGTLDQVNVTGSGNTPDITGRILPDVTINAAPVNVPTTFWGIMVASQGGPGLWQSFKNWWGNASDAYKMTKDFFNGTGLENRVYYNNRVTDALKNSDGARRARDFFYKKYKGVKDLTNAEVVDYRVSFGLKGLFGAGFDPIQQFVGGFSINVFVSGNNLVFAAFNVTSFRSLMYDMGPQWTRGQGIDNNGTPAMGNTYQEYIWTEPIKRP